MSPRTHKEAISADVRHLAYPAYPAVSGQPAGLVSALDTFHGPAR
jgi:hypothetical protein